MSKPRASQTRLGLRRARILPLLIDRAGGAWWVWDSSGDVITGPHKTLRQAVEALGRVRVKMRKGRRR